MLLMLPLGTLYFSLFVTLLALALSFISMPLITVIFNIPMIQFGSYRYFLPQEMFIPAVLLGLLILTLTMHAAKGLGFLQGKLAKKLLVMK